MVRLFSHHQNGFTLTELLIAMVVSAIIAAAAVSSFITQRQTLAVQDKISDMVDNGRAAMDIITRELRMAGYDPTEAGVVAITPADTTVCGSYDAGPTIRADLNGNGVTDSSGNPNEKITYCYDSSNLRLTRNSGSGNQPFVNNVSDGWIQYLDEDGNPTAVAADIKKIELSLTFRTDEPDRNYTANNGYRTHVLTSTITLRN